MRVKSTLIAIALCIATLMPISAKTKIACVGNSITFGYGIANRLENSYPAQLQKVLGDDYEVQNFGVSGTTILSKGNSPYIKRVQYKQSLAFMPDVVFIKLGTNDSKEMNMEFFDDFVADYTQFIRSYQALESKPRIILITPVRCYKTDVTRIYDPRITKNIIPAIERIAYETGVEIIDAHSMFDIDDDKKYVPDQIHPSAAGATIMVDIFSRHFLAKRDAEFDLFEQLSATVDAGEAKVFNYHGFEARDYTIDGLKIKVAKPKIANENHSWVLRARFWGNAPELELRLLELGFHVVYCDVVDLFGAPEAMKRWDSLYKIMTKAGLRDKMVLEGYSRGGLFIYNWALKYPKRVSALYADAPVLDPKSWPMACGESKGSAEMTERMLTAYGMKSREEMMKYSKNPIDNAKKIAKLNIPIIHVIGTADELVPVAENTAPFAEALRSYGGQIEIIEKDGIGHHPHSLAVPEPLVQFILKAEGLMEQK